MPDGFLNVLLYVPVFLFSLCAHEFAHAWVAVKRGDPTPEMLGRLTMHPLAHADLFGTFLLPILCLYNGWPFFGWARPVPIDSRNFKHGRRDMALVAAAGPAANVALALIATAGLAVMARLPLGGWMETLPQFAVVAIQVNILLALFNLIPIPPLDGFAVLQGMLTSRAALSVGRLQRHANLLLFLLLMTGGYRFLLAPAGICYRMLIQAAIGN